jgi:putrescine transport system ATP-binding protein
VNHEATRLQRTPAADARPDFVEVINVSRRYGESVAVDAVDLTIRKGEIFALLGSSGCGKSTLLRILAGLDTPDAGRIIVDGQDITAQPTWERPVIMMFQSYALFPHMDVEGNVGYGLRREGVRGAELRDRVAAALDLVQMGRFARRRPHQLSGGQQQRVALARSLVKRPKLLLLDEPMSALDKKIRQQTQFELGNILYSVGVTCILVTHDQEEAMTMADRIALMDEGRILQVGRPNDVYEAPACRFAAEFLGSTNLFEGELAADESRSFHCDDLDAPLEVRNPMNARQGRRVQLSLRPERIALAFASGDSAARCAANRATGAIEQIAYMGSYSMFYVRIRSGRLLAVNLARTAVHALERAPDYGDTVHLSWGPDHIVVLEG